MVHVLIGLAEALPAPEVVFSLLQAGHTVSAFALSANIPLTRLPLRSLTILPDPAKNAEMSVAILAHVMKGPDAPEIILPLDDTGLWLVDAAFGNDPRAAGAKGLQVRVALDKTLQVAAAVKAGLSVPQTVVVQSPDDIPASFPLPAIVKPAYAVRVKNGKLGKGTTIYLPDAAALTQLSSTLKADMEPLLLQPLIAGVGEGVFGYLTAEGVVGWSGHRRLRMMNPHGSGSSACISQTPSEDLRDKITRFLVEIGWHGPFMIEILRAPDGTAWFMELNGRMWGSLALARRQGLEYPAWAVSGALNAAFRPVPPPLANHPGAQRNLGREILHLLFVLRGPKSSFHRQDWPKFGQSLIGVFRPAHPLHFYNYDPAHRSFFLHDAFWTVRRALKR